MKLETKVLKTSFCVVGGGLAGLFAAVSAARHGVKTVLMQERPMLGGNSSSEIRMWVCGAQGKDNRETGLLEEMALKNLYYNPYKLWPQWDGLLYSMAREEENLTLLLNTSCMEARMDDSGKRIHSVTGWQMTTQCFVEVEAAFFADCSGDSILAPLTGAEYRVGREASGEFGEETSTTEPDFKTMGLSCMIGGRELDHAVEYRAPKWALKLSPEDLKRRRPNLKDTMENFWYLELGGDRDSIRDTENIREELLALAYGMWDAIKNSGEFPDTANWQLDFVGFLPGKRESRRMMGDYLMTQLDVADGGHFEDVAAYGGWPLDDHDPRGFWFSGHGCLQIQSQSPYGIPYRCLYSKNIENLFFAGRNISMTHAAMSSSRVMGTCAVVGQAVGTAAALAVRHETTPRGLYIQKEYLKELQSVLMDDGVFLPYLKRDLSDKVLTAELKSTNEGTETGRLEKLRNGIDRNNHTYGTEDQGVILEKEETVAYVLKTPSLLQEVRIVFDSDLNRDTIPGDSCEQYHPMRANVQISSPVMTMPKTLAKEYEVQIKTKAGEWKLIRRETENLSRLVKIPLPAGDSIAEIALKVSETWGDQKVHLFSFDFC